MMFHMVMSFSSASFTTQPGGGLLVQSPSSYSIISFPAAYSMSEVITFTMRLFVVIVAVSQFVLSSNPADYIHSESRRFIDKHGACLRVVWRVRECKALRNECKCWRKEGTKSRQLVINGLRQWNPGACCTGLVKRKV